jgi:putative phosphoesterase
MKIGVVSDTHGHVQNALAAARMLEALDVAAVLHCGDIDSPQIPACFSRWPTHYVLGNVDHYEDDTYAGAVNAAGGTFHARFADLTLGGRRIAVLHSDDSKRFKQTIASGDYDLVCYGHTHVAEQHQEGKTLVLNPGALQRANPHQIAVVDLETMEVTHVKV